MNSNNTIIIAVVVAIVLGVVGYYYFFSENKEAIALEFLTKQAEFVKDKKYKEASELSVEFGKKYSKVGDAMKSNSDFNKKMEEYLSKDDKASASKLIAKLM
jgi:predicted negative regulator of RcsB-dependent stress response